LKVSFFGAASVWQYWQLVAGNPAFLAAATIGGVANVAPAPTDTAKMAPAAAQTASLIAILSGPGRKAMQVMS
jgi:hypothetical protein